jgi:hypothetical protein
VEIESIREMLARAADTGHSNQHNAQGSTSFWMCKVRCWRWLFVNEIPISSESRSRAEKELFESFSGRAP